MPLPVSSLVRRLDKLTRLAPGFALLLLAGLFPFTAGLVFAEGIKEGSKSEVFDSDYLVSFWKKSEGLPDDTVNALLQTRDGYLWVGTAAGLARFDGQKFVTVEDETSVALQDASITALLEDAEGGLWAGTQRKGVFRLAEGRIERFTTQQGLAGNSVTSLAQSSDGAVWIGTQEGLSSWRGGRLERFVATAVPQGDGVVSLHAGASGALWITTRSGVFCLRDGEATAFKSDQLPRGRNAEFIGVYEDRSTNLWAFGATFLLNVTQGQSLNSFSSFNLASSRVWTICEQNNANFWIGTSGQGLFRFQGGRFEVVGVLEGLDQCDIRALHADRWGNLWIGTGGDGLVRLRPRAVKVVGANAGVHSQNLSAIAPDGEGGLWVGSVDAGLWHWDGRQAEPWSRGGALARVTQIQTLCLDRQTNLWVGTLGSGIIKVAGSRQLRLTTAEGLADDVILALAANQESGTVWAGTQSGILHRIRDNQIETFTSAQGLTGEAILCLLPGDSDRVLIGSQRGGLVRCDGTRLTKVEAPGEIDGKPIRCLFEDRKGRLWVGTWGGGAFCQTSKGWMSVTRGQGAGLENVGSIAQSGRSVIWLGTGENLFRARMSDVDAFLVGTRQNVGFMPAVTVLDGLKCAVGWPTAVQRSNEALWLACNAELLPLGEKEDLGSEPPPPVILERLLVNGDPLAMPQGGKLLLGPGTKSLDLEFTAISFTAPEKVRFRHKLEGFDSDWVESDVARRAHYGPLPPGDYLFRVIASNAEGIWNDTGASLALAITPPIWREWWFLSLATAAITAGIWVAARFISTRRLEARLRAAEQQHAMERERARIAQDMHDEIGSKLTRISFLSEIAQRSGNGGAVPSTPVEAIASTSRDLLQSLDEIVWAVNPKNDNLEQLAGYLEQHAREYFQGTTCNCKINVPVHLPDVPLSAEVRHNVFLAFEEALNNSLKHASARNLSVTMTVEREFFEVRLQDDGCGFDISSPNAPEDHGLRNMKRRLKAVDGTCEIASQPGVGTTVILRAPLANGSKTGSITEIFALKK